MIKKVACAILAYSIGALLWLAWAELFGKVTLATHDAEGGFIAIHSLLAFVSLGVVFMLSEKELMS